MILQAEDLVTALAAIGAVLLIAGVVGWARWQTYAATNVIVRRDADGGIAGVLRWHTTYTETSTIDTITDGFDIFDIFDAVDEIGRLDHHRMSSRQATNTAGNGSPPWTWAPAKCSGESASPLTRPRTST